MNTMSPPFKCEFGEKVGCSVRSISLIVACGLALLVAPVWASEGVSSVLPEIEGTELGKNLKLLENYYQQVNNQLNGKFKDGVRDPFQQLVQPPVNSVAPSSGFENSRSHSVASEKLKVAPGSVSSTPIAMRPIRGRNVMLPPMQFRGFMRVAGTSAALLDIQGVGAVVVKEGDKVGMGHMDSEEETVIRVVEINKLNVIVEVGSLGERVVVQ